MPQQPSETVTETVTGTAPAVDLSEFELPNSEPEPMKIAKKAPPTGASGERPGGDESLPPAPSKHSARTLRLAAHLGITQAEIEQSSREDLLHEIQAAQAEQQQLMMEANNGRSADIRNRPVEKPAEVEKPLWDETTGSWEEDDTANPGQKVKRTLNESDLAPPLVKVLKGLQKELAETKAKLEAKDQQTANQSRAQQIDAGFAALGDGYEKLFGKGSGLEMKKGDPNLLRRRAILHSLQIDPPEETLHIKDAIAKRVKELHGDSVPGGTNEDDPYALEPTPVRAPRSAPAPIPQPRRNPNGRPTAEDWEEGALAKPTSRTPRDIPKGRERAITVVKERMRQQNIGRNGEAVQAEEWDELPDA